MSKPPTSEPKSNSRPSLRLTFLGAAGTVTGSKFLVESDKRRILIDCGIFQGPKELRLRNWQRPGFVPSELDAIVLTHAHIDHSGYLPLVVRLGFSGPIFCTAATAELLKLLLPDAAHLQEEEARFANQYKTSKHNPAKPLFTQADASATLAQLKIITKHQANQILPGVEITPRGAGHILGSVSLSLDIAGRRISFSGDIGRYDTPLLPDPEPIDIGDILLCESTYGDKDHPLVDAAKELATVINNAAQKKGAIVIPAFAIGRTQNLLYYLAELERNGEIPILPVYIDSPMAVDATKIYRSFQHDYDDEAAALLAGGFPPLMTQNTSLCRSVEQSKQLNSEKGPRIIISASGMVTGGRILHHLTHLLPDEKNTVLFVGFQAVGTRGRTIQSRAETVKIFGRHLPIRADVQSISGLSAHGGRSELLKWLSSSSGTPAITRIIHGEPQPAESFAKALQEKFGWDAQPARHLETIEL